MSEHEPSALLSAKTAILQAITEGHALTQSELAHFLGIARSTASVYVRPLLADGFIEPVDVLRSGGRASIVYGVTPKGRTALARGVEFDSPYGPGKERKRAAMGSMLKQLDALDRRVKALEQTLRKASAALR